jgi:hypothetical protein
LGQTLFRYGSGFPDVEVKGAKRKQLETASKTSWIRQPTRKHPHFAIAAKCVFT